MVRFVKERSIVSSNSTVVSPKIWMGTACEVSPDAKFTVTGPVVKSDPSAVFPVSTTSTLLSIVVLPLRVTVTIVDVCVVSVSDSLKLAIEKS